MGKTYRKDGSNRNRYFVKNKKSSDRKPNNRDYEKMLNEYDEDEKYVEKDKGL